MSFSVNQRMLIITFKFISISFIILLMLFLYITLNSVNNYNENTITNDITNTKWLSITPFINRSNLCKLSFYDCSLALLLGLFISSKKLKLLGIV